MKKNITVIILFLLTTGILSGCGHQHVWQEATCTEPKTCTECGETEGSPLGHTWTAATCTIPKTCSVCGETDGTALEHTWIDATCTAPETCSVCGETNGTALEHTWIDATCTAPKTCSLCGETEGDLAEHDLDSTGKCRVCDNQIGFALNMSNYENYLKLTYTKKSDYVPSGEYYNYPDGSRIAEMVTQTTTTVKAEPVTNVTFVDVKITFKLSSGDKATVDINSTGYGTGIFEKYSPSSISILSITGYIIE